VTPAKRRAPAPRMGPATSASDLHRTRGPRPVVCAVITVSDTRRGPADTAGAAIQSLLEQAGHRVVSREWVKDDVRAIRAAVKKALARPSVDAAILTGGTGAAARDVTPEALQPLVDRWLPGFGELFRWRSLSTVGTAAWLSRAAAGIVRDRLVVLLPGSEPAVRQAVADVLLPELVHVIRLLGRFPSED